MIRVQRNPLLDFDVVDPTQDGQSVAHADDPHLLQFIVLEGDQGFADDFVFCGISPSAYILLIFAAVMSHDTGFPAAHVPIIFSPYCGNPRLLR